MPSCVISLEEVLWGGLLLTVTGILYTLVDDFQKKQPTAGKRARRKEPRTHIYNSTLDITCATTSVRVHFVR